MIVCCFKKKKKETYVMCGFQLIDGWFDLFIFFLLFISKIQSLKSSLKRHLIISLRLFLLLSQYFSTQIIFFPFPFFLSYIYTHTHTQSYFIFYDVCLFCFILLLIRRTLWVLFSPFSFKHILFNYGKVTIFNYLNFYLHTKF